MNALGTANRKNPETRGINQAEVIDYKDFTYHVYLVNGAVQEVAPATALRLTDAEVIFVLGELIVTRLPRRNVYLVARQPTAPPVLF